MTTTATSKAKLRLLSTFLREERVRAHERMRQAQRILDDPDLDMDLGASGRDTLEAIRRNAEEDFAGVIHLLAVWADRFRSAEGEGEGGGGVQQEEEEDEKKLPTAEEEEASSPLATADKKPAVFRQESSDNEEEEGGAGDVGLGLKIDNVLKEPGAGDGGGDGDGDGDGDGHGATASPAANSTLDVHVHRGDDVDDFDPLLNEDDARLGAPATAASQNLIRRTGSLLASSEPENEEERREEEDVVPDNLSRLPPGSGAGAFVAGRFTATPAVRVAEGAPCTGAASGASDGDGGVTNLARSLPVTVPVPEKVSRAPDLPPEVDQDITGPSDIPANIEMIARSLHVDIHGELPSPPKRQLHGV